MLCLNNDSSYDSALPSPGGGGGGGGPGSWHTVWPSQEEWPRGKV